MGGAWKVAYADFVTAMMAFFLLMWILNMTSSETKAGLAKYFTEGAEAVSNISSPISRHNDNPIFSTPGKFTSEQMQMRETQRNTLNILNSLRKEIAEDSSGSITSGTTTDDKGVTLQILPNLLFQPGTAKLAPGGDAVLGKVASFMQKYKTYLVVQGHTDRSETGAPTYPSKWELSAARANAAVEDLIAKGVNPKYVRSIAYADTQPEVPPSFPNAQQVNGRVVFIFHRPEVMSSLSSF